MTTLMTPETSTRTRGAKSTPARRSIADSWPSWTDAHCWTTEAPAPKRPHVPIDHRPFKKSCLAEVAARVRLTDRDHRDGRITAAQHREIRAGLLRERRAIEAVPDQF